MDKMPLPQPTSSTVVSGVKNCSSVSSTSRVVSCPPVPNAMPGSMDSTVRPSALSADSHVGQISSFSPTANGLKYCFQLLAQSASCTGVITSSCAIPSCFKCSCKNAAASAGLLSGLTYR